MIYRQVSLNKKGFYVPEHLVGILTGILALCPEISPTVEFNWGISILVYPQRVPLGWEELTHDDTIRQAGV